jgi:4a-hydroxytetrahydrobiopterin dehydratase
MVGLTSERCVACRADAPRVTDEEIAELRAQIPQWSLVERDGILRLERTYRLDGFRAAMAFAERIADLAEEQAHHPVLQIDYNRVTVTWWTHKIRWLHRNDFIMAAKTDLAFEALAPDHPAAA